MTEKFGSRLKHLRIQKGLSQEQLAQIIRIDRTAISYYERDESQPPIETILIIAKAFHVTTDYLLGASNDLALTANGLSVTDIETLIYLAQRLSEANEKDTKK